MSTRRERERERDTGEDTRKGVRAVCARRDEVIKSRVAAPFYFLLFRKISTREDRSIVKSFTYCVSLFFHLLNGRV